MMSMIMSSPAAQQHIRRLLSDNANGNEGGFSNDKDFHMNLIALAALIVFLFIAFHVTDRVIRCCYDFERLYLESQELERRQRLAEMSTGPTLAFSTGLELAGEDQDMCSVCLSEFVEGDEIRVLPRCKHGFHVRCIESWLVAAQNTSCPTCRTSCLRTPSDHEQQQQQHIDVEVGEASTSETGASSSRSKDEVDLQSKLKMKEVLET